MSRIAPSTGRIGTPASGSALNHQVHLHVCASDGVFVPTGDGPPAFLPARPLMQADLATLTGQACERRVRHGRLLPRE